MQAPQSSDDDGLPGPDNPARGARFTNFHIAVSAFAALAGVIFAGIQTFVPGSLPVNVTLAVDPPASASNMDITKTTGGTVNVNSKADGTGEPALQLAAVELDGRATFTGALKDASAGRYSYRDLFDGRPETFVTIEAPENEINMLVELPASETIGGIEYTPPRDAGGLAPAAVLDVMILPENQLEASGSPVMSFALQTSPGSQTFTLPQKGEGKGLWLRLAGPAGMGDVAVGDLKVLRAVR
jgi:hypothetical protein